MIISISQPTLFPWLGYFDIIKNSDIFICLDNVKFEKRSWQMRNKLKIVSSDNESEVWIRIPTKNVSSKSIINEVMIDNTQKWKNNHLIMFQNHYGNDCKEINFIQKIYEKEWDKLADFNIDFIKNCCSYLNIDTKIFRASELSIEGKKSQLLLNICQKLKATTYLSTIGAKEYLDIDKGIFEKEHVEIKYHNYIHPKYSQKGKNFIEKLSILDLIFNEQSNAKKYFQ